MQPWIERVFRFETDVQLFPLVLERLIGTPARIEDKVRKLAGAVMTHRLGGTWSLQDHIGHLADLDSLHSGRLDDYDAGAESLRPADMSNQKTWDANHNAMPLADVLQAFRQGRQLFVFRLQRLDHGALERSARHPRLDRPMRVIDMALFVAEHDDHHLARMTELVTAMR